MIKNHNLSEKIIDYFTGSVRKKITGIIILPVVLSLILVSVGTFIIDAQNIILLVVRMEREWLDVNLNGFKYLNKYMITGDKDDLNLSLENLENGYSINRIGPKLRALTHGENVDRKKLAKQMDEVFYSLTEKEAAGVIRLVGLLGSHDYVKNLMDLWKGSFEDFERNMSFVYQYSQTGDEALIKPIFKFAEDFKQKGDDFSEYSAKLSALSYSLMTKVLWGFFLLFSFITLAISFFYTNRMIIAFNSITEMLKVIADGDMSQRLHLKQKDEIGMMAQAVNSICEKVGNNISQVIASSGKLSTDSFKQASSVEEISASLEEMSSMTRRNADNSGQVNKLMKQAGGVVSKADGFMTEMTASMDEISKSGEATSKIIKTIDEIAFQTNLLSLNAAIEAARVGEAGAGFGVVADEVRMLAMRAAEASKNTADLIEGMSQKIKNGSEMLSSANAAFVEISDVTFRAGNLIDEITLASGEQADGIKQINEAIAEVDKITQQNASNAEDLSANANLFKV